MKQTVEFLLKQAVYQLQHMGKIASNITIDIKVEYPKDKAHGDITTNLALVLAKQCGILPRPLAELLVECLPTHEHVERIEVAAPGFINFFMSVEKRSQIISTILEQGQQYGRRQMNPTVLRRLNMACQPKQTIDFIQYAHARTSSVLRQFREGGITFDEQQGCEATTLLSDPLEQHLMVSLARYPEVLHAVVTTCEPQQLTSYLHELANGLHSYYNAVQLLCEDEALRAARLCLLRAVRQVLCNGLELLSISAPESM